MLLLYGTLYYCVFCTDVPKDFTTRRKQRKELCSSQHTLALVLLKVESVLPLELFEQVHECRYICREKRGKLDNKVLLTRPRLRDDDVKGRKLTLNKLSPVVFLEQVKETGEE